MQPTARVTECGRSARARDRPRAASREKVGMLLLDLSGPGLERRQPVASRKRSGARDAFAHARKNVLV